MPPALRTVAETTGTASGLHAVAEHDTPAGQDAPAAHTFGPIRPDRLTVWPTESGSFGIDVRWHGRECILRAVVVRRLLAEAGYEASAGNSLDGRTWELHVGPVPAEDVGKVITTFIW
jgi:hypothetical protein